MFSLSVQLALASALPGLESHGTSHNLAQRSKEVHVSLDAEAYMNDVSTLGWVSARGKYALAASAKNSRS